METTSPNEVSPNVMHPVRWIGPDDEVYLVDWRDIEEAMRRNPGGRTLPRDGDELMLTAEDCAWLWGIGIAF